MGRLASWLFVFFTILTPPPLANMRVCMIRFSVFGQVSEDDVSASLCLCELRGSWFLP